jgi:hypothetical protein
MGNSKLLFVCGFPSGGTDLTKTILNVHPDIWINGEMPFLKDIAKYGYEQETLFADIESVRAFQQVLRDVNTWGNIENLDHNFSAEIEDQGQLRLSEVLKTCFSAQERRIWGNKTPQNTENIQALSSIFPGAYFLIVIRDVRDVCLSWHNKWGKDMVWCSAKWAHRMHRGWIVTKNMSQERYLFVKFEDLLSDTEACCRRICAFLDVPFSGRMLEHHNYTTERIDGKINYGQKIVKSNKKKWSEQLSHKTVRRIEEIAFDTMRTFDYEVVSASGPRSISWWERARGVWNDLWSLLLVGNRARQNNALKQKIQGVFFELRKKILDCRRLY